MLPRTTVTASITLVCAALAFPLNAQHTDSGSTANAALAGADDTRMLLTIDHYVPVVSKAPVIDGQIAQIFVQERVEAGVALRAAHGSPPVVLFVHGAGTPAEVAFDVPYEDYSWMSHLARAGFDVFSMEMTGYGRSTRPLVMNDPCNVSASQQAILIPRTLGAPCEPSYPHDLTTSESDWNDLDGVVEYLRALRDVERVSLIAWSQGGMRAGGYAAQYPAKIDRLVLFAPVYPTNAAARPGSLPDAGLPMTTQTYDAFVANWERQLGCPDQYDPGVREAVWRKMLRSDPVGATWGPGVRRAPSVTSWGWGQPMAERITAPTLIVAGIHDAQVNPARPRQLYQDLKVADRVFIDLGCTSHNAMWERNHLLLFEASLEWLKLGTVQGQRQGELRIGY
jgi:pimeloyl-ACP methyl ester carboxylesterase